MWQRVSSSTASRCRSSPHQLNSTIATTSACGIILERYFSHDDNDDNVNNKTTKRKLDAQAIIDELAEMQANEVPINDNVQPAFASIKWLMLPRPL
jgi:hypothetical protein